MRNLFLRTTLIAAMGGGASLAGASPVRPNILVLLTDDLTDDILGCYGGRVLTPAIDSLAERGIRFTQTRAAATVCTPSRYGFQTGHFAGRCDEEGFIDKNPLDQPYTVHFNVKVHEHTPTVAKALRDAGYFTGMSGKWHVGRHGLQLGLPRLDPDADPDDPDVDALLRRYQEVAVQEVQSTAGYEYAAAVFEENCDHWYMPRALRYHHMEWITAGSLDFFDQWDQTSPFFFFYASTVRHGPSHQESLAQDPIYTIGGKLDEPLDVQPPRHTIETRLREAGIQPNFNTTGQLWLDDSVEAILNRLDEMGVLEDTLIFFCSDHGNIPGKGTLYETGVRVPMIMAWPGRIEPGAVTDALVSNMDVVATILDAAGVEPPPEMVLDGESLVPLVTGETDRIHDYVFMEQGFSRGVTDGRWKYMAIRFPDWMIEKMETGALEMAPNLFNDHNQSQAPVALSGYPHMFEPDQLYDLKNDPKEQDNLARHPEYAHRLEAMKNTLAEYTGTFEHPFPRNPHPFQWSSRYDELIEETRRRIPAPEWWIHSRERRRLNL